MLNIRKSEKKDINELLGIFDEARMTIARLGIDQWQNGYPSRDVIEEDISAGQSYACELDGKLVGTFVILTDGEPSYDAIFDGKWRTGDGRNYLAIHRVAIRVASRGTGISSAIIAYAKNLAKEMGRASLRIDTHEGNAVMRRMLEKNGFEYCGNIFLETGDIRVAYEKVI